MIERREINTSYYIKIIKSILKNNGPDRLNSKERLKVVISREDFLGGSYIVSFLD